MIVSRRFEVLTKGNDDVVDLTPALRKALLESELSRGTATLFVTGSTAGLTTIEFEPGLERDLPEALDRLLPPSRQYGHEQAWHDGNGHSHLQATLLGPSLAVPIRNGALALGTWQQIFHLECDIKPRQRTVVVTVVGE